MSAPPAVAGRRAPSQRVRNLVAAAVVGGVILVLAASYLLLLPHAQGVAGALCTFGFLAVAFVAWEFLMKPDYGLFHRGKAEGEDEPADAPPTAQKMPRSPRPP